MISSALRLVGRFVGLFFTFYLLIYLIGTGPFPLDSLPLSLLERGAAKVGLPFSHSPSEWIGKHVLTPYANWMDGAVKSFAARVFHLNLTIGPNGSGDTTWNYVQIVAFGFVAFVAAAIAWTIALAEPWFARRGPYLLAWARALVRLNLATTMITYGAMKVIKSQMPTPGIDALMVPFGEHSPMNLLWSYVGFSHAYCVFTGLSEMVGGLLLCARRTATIGALVSAGVMAHVAMMNYCFDTPVKLFSTNLFVMAAWLAAPEVKRLFDFFVRQRPVALRPVVDLIPGRVPHWIAVGLRMLFIGGFAFTRLEASWEYRKQGDLAEKPPLYGAWDVDIFEVDGELISEDSENFWADPWRRVLIGRYRMRIDQRDGAMRCFFAQPAAAASVSPLAILAPQAPAPPPAAPPTSFRLNVSREDDPNWKTLLKCEKTGPDELTIDGPFEGHQIHAELVRAPDPFLLTNRGFHWINEYPLNR